MRKAKSTKALEKQIEEITGKKFDLDKKTRVKGSEIDGFEMYEMTGFNEALQALTSTH